jgi:tRNA G10  N-methylase Trm11
LQDKDRTKVGILQIHENLEATETDSRIVIELVEVGFVLSQQPFSQRFVEDSKPPLEESGITQWFKSYKVMWVEWNDGIAYRKGLGEVTRSNWEEYRGEQFALMLG